jgi:4-amino-4-deoxy-L-arabinose transferase-like glycosyltransferase
MWLALKSFDPLNAASRKKRKVGWGERSEPQHFGKFAGVRFTRPSLRSFWRSVAPDATLETASPVFEKTRETAPARRPAEWGAGIIAPMFSLLPLSPRALQIVKQLGLALFCLVWIALGLADHAPWKSEDAKTVTAAVSMVQSGDFLVPRLATEPSFDSGVVVPQLAAATAKLFSPLFPAHDAARLSAGLLLFLTLLFTALAAKSMLAPPEEDLTVSYGEDHRKPDTSQRFWIPMFVLIGSIGLFDQSHMLSPQLGAMAALAAGAFSLALMRKRPGTGGALYGLSAAFGVLAWNAAFLWVFVVVALVLPFANAAWRTKFYATAMGVAIAVAVIFCGGFALLLYQRSPELLTLWRSSQPDPLSWARVGRNIGWIARNIWWLAFPSWALIAWFIRVRARGFNGGFKTPAVALYATLSIVAALFLLGSPHLRAIDTLPLLVPLALLASEEIDSLPRGGSAALDWFGILTFGIAAAALWYFWWDVYLNGMSSYAARLFHDAEAGFKPSFHLRAASASLLLTILWILLVRPARQSARRAVLNWAAGMMLVSGMIATIWMPYLDSRRSYHVVAKMIQPYAADGCVATRGVGDAQRTIFYYYAGAVSFPKDDPKALSCSLYLVSFHPAPGARVKPETLKGYKLLGWSHRYGDDEEYYALYKKR